MTIQSKPLDSNDEGVSLVAVRLVTLVVAGAFCMHCGGGDYRATREKLAAENVTEGVTRRDVQLLTRFMKVPLKPLSVSWQTQKNETRPSWSLTALLTYSQTDLETIVAGSAHLPRPVVIADDHLAHWFPESLRERYKAAPREQRGVIASDAELMEPTAFVDVDRSPLVDGYVGVFWDAGLLYVKLFTAP